MVETARSLSQIYTLLADNTSGQISAQDVRDAVKTLAPGYAEITVTSEAATIIANTSTFYPVAGTWALSSGGLDWDMNTNGQLRYTGAPNRIAYVIATASFTSGNNQTIYVAIAKNGTAITPSIVHKRISTGADVVAVPVHTFTTVATNDYLTLVVRNTSSTASVEMETGNVSALSLAL